LALAECWYWIRELQARYVAGDYPVAMEASAKAQRLLWTLSGLFDKGRLSLSRVASLERPRPESHQQLYEFPRCGYPIVL